MTARTVETAPLVDTKTHIKALNKQLSKLQRQMMDDGLPDDVKAQLQKDAQKYDPTLLLPLAEISACRLDDQMMELCNADGKMCKTNVQPDSTEIGVVWSSCLIASS